MALGAILGGLGRAGYALAGEGYALAGSAGPAYGLQGAAAASSSKQAAQSLLAVTENLKRTDRAARDVARGGGAGYLRNLEAMSRAYLVTSAAASSVVSRVEGLGTSLTTKLTAPLNALHAVGESFVHLTALANPAAAKQWELATRDAYAVVGRALTPATNAMTRAMRTLGDEYAKAEPVLNGVATEVAHVTDSIGRDLVRSLKELRPTLEATAEVLNVMAAGSAGTAHVLSEITLWMTSFPNAVLRALGFGKAFKDGASASGAAVRDVRVTRSAEDVSRQAQEQALHQVLSKGGEKKGEKLPDIYELLNTHLPTFPTKEDVRNFLKDLVAGVVGAPAAAVGAGGNAAKDLFPVLAFIRAWLLRH